MLLNQGKTQVVLFGRDVEHEIINLLLDSKPVEQKDSKVHLGVFLTQCWHLENMLIEYAAKP